MDDVFVLKDNPQIAGGIDSIPAIFSSPYFSNDNASFGYRPLTKVMYALEYDLFGINLPVHHTINILLYALCGILVFRFLRRYFEQLTGMLFVWIVFLIWFLHPLHTEVVASLKNREELLWVIFDLLSIVQFEKFIEKKNLFALIFALFFFVVSYLAKQSALSLVLVMPLLIWFRFGQKIQWKQISGVQLRSIIVVAFTGVMGYLLYKFPAWVFQPDTLEMYASENPIRFTDAVSVKVSISAMAMLYNLRLLIFPHPLIFYYGLYQIPDLPVFSWQVLFSAVVHLGIIVFTIVGLRKRKVWALGSAFYLFSIFLFSNLPIEINGIVGERFLFLPSLGFAIAFTALVFGLTRNNLYVKNLKLMSLNLRVILFIIFLLFSIKTMVRNTSWRDSLTLYKNDIRYASRSVQAHNILAGEMMDCLIMDLNKGCAVSSKTKEIQQIIHYFRKSWLLFPESYRTMNNLGDLYLNFGNNPDSALLFLAGAYKLKPESFYVRFNIARCFDFNNEMDKAEYWYLSAIQVNPDIPKTHELLNNLRARKLDK
ncbi:MAG: hypothetical protein CVU05_05330 [Bacteroidetes bacterium HGW-Bacteroidetes-21]|nr:MAG: hypothetical protein CVU05_05330 [Bacteroidetes bacterium HGW-Bacteroidetes-21]